jgi:hypothetical protein
MYIKSLTKLLLSLTVFSLSTVAFAQKKELPEITEDGLHRVHDAKMAIVYAEPGADLSAYGKVLILEPYVAFKKNWARNQRTQSSSSLRVTSKDVENIKKGLAEEFHAVFQRELEAGGYPVVDQAAEDVLLDRPAIINLDVNAPDTPRAGMSQTYVASAGEMTLYLEIYDSVTGDLIAKALDRRADNRNSGFYTWANSVSNKMAADRILKGWATILVSALNEAKSSPSQSEGSE